MAKFYFSIYELLGLPKKGEKNITLGVLTQESKEKGEEPNLHGNIMLRALKDRFGNIVEKHEDTIITRDDFELLDDSIVSDNYLETIIELFETLNQGVEILIVERNLGFKNDIAVFDIPHNPITQYGDARHWILISSENTIGENKYENCPFFVGFKDKANNIVDQTILYTKKDILSILPAIRIAYDTAIQNESFARLHTDKNPNSSSSLQLAIDKLAENKNNNKKNDVLFNEYDNDNN
ncbi:hypothetical protein [Photobacterium leiognathi]|uniref:hypothetical protein n=1 Tax=Photobacterium leiognathi TaxID=553611 RepID=UPI00298256A0|nr:hypothetical protein [Photobacterium leiognathi]